MEKLKKSKKYPKIRGKRWLPSPKPTDPWRTICGDGDSAEAGLAVPRVTFSARWVRNLDSISSIHGGCHWAKASNVLFPENQSDATGGNLTATFPASDLGGDNRAVPLSSIACMVQQILLREKPGEWGVPFTPHNGCVAFLRESKLRCLAHQCPTLGPTLAVSQYKTPTSRTCTSASLADHWSSLVITPKMWTSTSKIPFFTIQMGTS